MTTNTVHPFNHICPGPYRFLGVSTVESRATIPARSRWDGVHHEPVRRNL